MVEQSVFVTLADIVRWSGKEDEPKSLGLREEPKDSWYWLGGKAR